MSKIEMKEISGGRHTHSSVCTCGNNTIVCGYSSLAGFNNCNAMAVNYCQTHNGGSMMSCQSGPVPAY